MSGSMRYLVIHNRHASDLSKDVTTMIESGWKLSGSLYVVQVQTSVVEFAQAVVKDVE